MGGHNKNMEHHWAKEKFEEINEATENTSWTFEEPVTEAGPIILHHEDGSEVSLVNSTFTNTYPVEYKAGEDAEKEAVSDEHVSFTDLDNAMEWFIHVLQRHEKIN